jgi:hypothetical protein
MTTKVFITYAHKDGPASNRFRQYIDDPLPPWAVDVREEAATPTPLQIEEDGDEIFCPVTRGCQQWWCVRDNGYVPVKLEKGSNGFWTCPKCKGSYGECE